MSWYNVGNFEEAVLSVQLDTSDSQMTIQALDATESFVTPTGLALLAESRSIEHLKAGELVVVTNKTGWTYDITRATPIGDRATWPVGTYVFGNFFAEHLEQVTAAIDNLQWSNLYNAGGNDDMQYGIYRTGASFDATVDFKIIPKPSTNNAIRVYGGMCIINRVPIHIDQTTYTDIALDATGSQEFSVFVHDTGIIDATLGYTPGAVFTDKFLLGVTTTDTTARQLITGDINDERLFF